MRTKKSVFMLSIVVVLLSACGEKVGSPSPTQKPQTKDSQPTPDTEATSGTAATAAPEETAEARELRIEAEREAQIRADYVRKIPRETPDSFPKKIELRLIEVGAPTFGEVIQIAFEREGLIFSRNVYVFIKSYVGKDNLSWFWWQEDDEISWSTPWNVISLDLKQMKILAGDEAGEGVEIGEVIFDGQHYYANLSVPIKIHKEQNRISINEPESQLPQNIACPQAVKMANMCELYTGIYAALSSIDYSAFGESGPDIFTNVVSFKSVFHITKSVWSFKPNVDSIRTEYLVPMLKAISQLKQLQNINPKNRDAYLEATTVTYSNLVVTSLDTILKTQKMMPEAIANAGGTGIGVVLAYIGMNETGDAFIGRKQPAWFTEIVAPVIREFGVISLDILLNGSNTPLSKRLDRLVGMEAQVRSAVTRLCKSSPISNLNECMAALN